MLKKLLLLSFAAFTMAACNDEADDGVRYATHNPSIVDGVFTSDNMHFYGTATVTHVSDGSTYTDPKAWFEFAGDRESLTIYMHATRFAAAMPALEMRIHRMPYTPGEGASLSFSAASTVPQVRLPNEVGGGYSLPGHALVHAHRRRGLGRGHPLPHLLHVRRPQAGNLPHGVRGAAAGKKIAPHVRTSAAKCYLCREKRYENTKTRSL